MPRMSLSFMMMSSSPLSVTSVPDHLPNSTRSPGFTAIAILTLSVGIDTYTGRTESSPDELRARANKALHVAKRNGKDQVWLFDQDGTGRAEDAGRRKSDPPATRGESEAAE